MSSKLLVPRCHCSAVQTHIQAGWQAGADNHYEECMTIAGKHCM